jgi:hypothetical protein
MTNQGVKIQLPSGGQFSVAVDSSRSAWFSLDANSSARCAAAPRGFQLIMRLQPSGASILVEVDVKLDVSGTKAARRPLGADEVEDCPRAFVRVHAYCLILFELT